MKTSIQKIICLLVILSAATSGFAQDPNAPFWGKQDQYLHRQSTNADNILNSMLAKYPPAVGDTTLERRSALMLLDQMVHDTRLDGSQATARFMDSRLQLVLDDLGRPLRRGMKIYKLYNSSFVVRTPDATVAFDIYRGPKCREGERRLCADSLVKAIVERCDIMFLSHNHPDHVDPAVVDMFTSAGKQVVAPTSILPDNDKVTHIREEKIVERGFTLPGGRKISVKILPGHQDDMFNNIYVVKTGSGHTFAHTGDQWNREDLSWLLAADGSIPRVDALIINCWANSLADTAAAFAPRLVVPAHENELGHTIDHRESYWASFDKFRRIPLPSVLMVWGESVFVK